MITTFEDGIIKSSDEPFKSTFMLNCKAEEADVKLIRHALHCLNEGYKLILVKTIDSDVLVLLISYFGKNIIEADPPFTLYADL